METRTGEPDLSSKEFREGVKRTSCGLPGRITAPESRRTSRRRSSTGVSGNTGLGLFLIREILSITGITIQENGTPGEGAGFGMDRPGRSIRVHP
ncbi:MAG TPA: hypothetical protein VLY83_00415 [Methanoregula sp.]|nr:hypothetical protein [Methanoregula sp.]